MKFYVIEQPVYDHSEYPSFLGVDGGIITNGRSDKYFSIETNSSSIIIRSKTGEVSETFSGGVSTSGKTIREINTSKPYPKYLLWFVWIGMTDATMLIKSIISYFKIGGYVGDVVVLTDMKKPVELNRFPTVRFITANAKQRLGKTTINKANIYCLKPMIVDYVDVHQYDWMVYSDADILCVKPSLMQLFQAMNDKSFIWYAKDVGTVARHQKCQGFGILTDEELIKYKDFSVNAGWIHLPCNDLGLDVLHRWSEINRSRGYEWDDQGVLYSLLIRETWSKRLALGIKGWHDGLQFSPPHCESQLIHFYNGGYGKSSNFDPMVKELGL